MSLEVNRKPKADFDYVFSFSSRFFHRFSLLNCASLSGDGFKAGTKEISPLTKLALCSFLCSSSSSSDDNNVTEIPDGLHDLQLATVKRIHQVRK